MMQSIPIKFNPHLITSTAIDETPRAPDQPANSKIKAIWDTFLHLCQQVINCIKRPFIWIVSLLRKNDTTLIAKINTLIQKIDEKEAAYKQVTSILPTLTSKEMAVETEARNKKIRQEWIDAIDSAFTESIKSMKAAKMDPTHPSKEVALQLTEILNRFAITLYANNDAPHPFQCSSDVLKATLLMQQYALGLNESPADYASLSTIHELYTNKEVIQLNTTRADASIDSLQPDAWAAKAKSLNQKQLFTIVQILRFTTGAMRYLKQTNLSKVEKMLSTAEACLLTGKNNTQCNLADVNNELAELKYNEMTGFFAAKIAALRESGETQLAQQLDEKLKALWEECVQLSNNPEKMQARCDNKRTFIEKMTPQQEAEFRKKALQRHLALPKEKQDPMLIAFAWHNLSHAQDAMGNLREAFESARQSQILATACQATGNSDVQLKSVFENSKRLSAKMLEALKAQ